ncbi:unnamed protein product [Clonostachys rhizophaga]|uniref:Aminoglycoside phosphotransferase domain-containing protein n=1 Tax=Clonostachys rhizophaga TaxID=160324 RepID=A0A9N9YB96_9HYPO|nr:unnamed protein product [Clonostachys rhizophaga]
MDPNKQSIYHFASFSLTALLALASRLRGQPCSCDRTTRPSSDDLNWYILLTFADGIEWVFRVPHTGRSQLKRWTASRLIVSEVATLVFVKAHTRIPVPEVYAYEANWTNEIGVPFMLMSKAPGRRLSAYGWVDHASQSKIPAAKRLRDISDNGKIKVMHQLGALSSELSRHRFSKIGSLVQDRSGYYSIEQCLAPGLTWGGRDSLGRIARGPFDTEGEYLDALVTAYSLHTKKLDMGSRSFFAPVPDPVEYDSYDKYRDASLRWSDYIGLDKKAEQGSNRLQFCIAAQLVRDMIPRMTRQRSWEENEGFPLAHPDLNFDNVFVDDKLNISCIVNWGGACSAPVPDALVTPGPRDIAPYTMDPRLVIAFRNGFEQAAGMGRPYDRRIWERADQMLFFQRLVRMRSMRAVYDFEKLFEMVNGQSRDHPTLSNLPELFAEVADTGPGNKQLRYELEMFEWCNKQVDTYVPTGRGGRTIENIDRVAVAQKLTMMAEMNKKFIADGRLWRWIEAALEGQGAPPTKLIEDEGISCDYGDKRAGKSKDLRYQISV